MSQPTWLARDILLLLHAEGIAEHGGLSGMRDAALLDSALARPENLHAYEPEADLFRLAAAYAFGIVRNHPFADGNKRAAFVAAAVFLELNGVSTALPEHEAIAAMLDLAAGDLPEDGLAAWLRDRSAASD